jgi:DNA replication protein DnaC
MRKRNWIAMQCCASMTSTTCAKTSKRAVCCLSLITHRYERGSLIITSNQSFKDWDQLFEDTLMTMAAIDKLVHHATIIHCEGDSYRCETALKQEKN